MMAESRRKAEKHLSLTPLEETRGSNVLRELSIRIASYRPKLRITRIMTTKGCYKKLRDLLFANKEKEISLSINWGWAKSPYTNLIPVQSSIKVL
ncbi:hypothetical protein B0O99DRAFT_615391 [Bisporella sp. PMI_857]|nr:hypothetical protein B0O99DRAFT_615391 [Bisporella sp. PMI_857]